MTRQATDGLYIDLEYFTPEEYYVYVAEGRLESGYYIDPDYIELNYYEDRAGNTRFALACELTEVVGEVKEFEAALSASATATPTGGKLQDAEVIVDALFTPSVSVDITRRSDVYLEQFTDLTVTASKFTGYESLQEFFAALNAQNDRIRNFDTAQSASFDATPEAARLRSTEVSLAVSFEQSAEAEKIILAEATLTDAFDFSADVQVQVLVDFSADFATTATVVANAISFVPKVLPYGRPIDLDSAPYIFDSNNKYFGTHSLRTNFITIEFTELTTSVIPSNGEDCVIEFWFNPDAGLLVNSEPAFLTYGLAINQDLSNTNEFTWGFGRTSGTTNYYQFKFWHGNTIYVLRDQTTYSTRIQQNDGWNHLAFVRENNVGKFYVNNSLQDQVSLPSNSTFRTPPTSSYRKIYIGGLYTTGSTSQGANYDELRIARGTAQRKTFSNAALNDENTVLLYHFDNSGLDDVQQFLDGEANLATTATITAVPNSRFDSITIHQSLGTLTVVADVFTPGEASITSNFALSAQPGTLEDASATLSSEFAQTATSNILVSADAILYSEANITETVSIIRDVTVDTESIATQLVAVAKVGDYLVTIESVADLSASAEVLRTVASNLASAFTQTVDAIKAVEANSSLGASANLQISVDRIRAVDSAVSSAFTQTATAIKTTEIEQTLSSSFVQTAEVDKFSGNQVQMSSAFVQSTTADRIREFGVTLSGEFAQTTSGIKAVEAVADLASAFIQTAQSQRIRPAVIDTESIATQLSVVAKIGDYLVTVESIATLSAVARVTTGNTIEAFAEFTQTADNDRFRLTGASINSTATMSIEPVIGIAGEAHIDSEFTQTTDAVKRTDATAIISGAMQFDASVRATKNNEIAAFVDSDLTATAQIIKGNAASLSSEFAQTVLVGKVIQGSATANAQFAQTANVRIIAFLDQYIYTIPRETRAYTVRREQRGYTIDRENRIYTVRG